MLTKLINAIGFMTGAQARAMRTEFAEQMSAQAAEFNRRLSAATILNLPLMETLKAKGVNLQGEVVTALIAATSTRGGDVSFVREAQDESAKRKGVAEYNRAEAARLIAASEREEARVADLQEYITLS